MFEQHPVPQNISSYQFHLVGDMTLKQFLELAGGVVVGILFYVTGFPSIIKWPLIGISVIFGAALAFVPLEERPLEQWIVAFFRSVYSPTLFHWEKRDGVKYFQDETQPGALNQTSTTNATAPKLDTAEKSYLSRLSGILSPSSSAVTQNPMPAPVAAAPKQPQIIPNTANQVTMTASIPANQTGGVLTMNVQPTQPITQNIPTPTAGTRDIAIPHTGVVSMDKSQRPQVTVQEIPQTGPANNLQPTQVGETLVGQKIDSSTVANAQFSTEAAPPSLPTIANTISGQVMSSDGKIIEGAVLEILDSEGRSVRALRTNKAGHFLNVTPLMDGKYKITIEKDGFNFEPIEFEAKNNIIQPIAIHAK